MRRLGIYIHIPFCKKKCKYCDFISYSNCDSFMQDRYVKNLIETIKKSKANYNLNNYEVDTIYFGGGTPSYISENNIELILKVVKENFNVNENSEITIEVNPGTATEIKLKKYIEIGINRISIGCQAIQKELLEMLGRIHNFDEFLKTYNLAKEVGFKNINVDLMLGLPNQTEKDLEDSINEILKLDPNHISIYSLIVEDETILKKEIEEGKLELPSDELERKMYSKIKKMLENKKYKHYEISNFAKSGFESKHNMACWEQEEYLGFGIAAHSYFNKKRFSNIEDFEEYNKNIENKEFEKNVELQEEQDDESQKKEYMLLGLRKIEGVSISKFEQKFRINPLFYFRFEISKLEHQGLIEVDLDNIKLTRKGLNLANLVWEEFV